ncbi:MAG: MSMEG_0569 family flavin-dependent oxidoreductase [Xanthobacteraceae bacterium]|nr:MSMEG_0569 family flavin-dependent oxidoreductase [Xanthobacteraceae bacterium]
MTSSTTPHHSVVVIGGGQAGLSMSFHLKQAGIDHVVLEKERVAHTWRTQRWDAFCLVTPNWQCKLPGFHYLGNEPHGFMPKDDIVAYVENYARHFGAPVREGVAVEKLARDAGGKFSVATSEGALTADAVVLAVGGYHKPNIPRMAERLPESVVQIHSSTYRNPSQLPEGEVLVVGSGQSGCQIAEDIHLAGRKVHLVVGSAPRCPRFYRGRDAVDWLDDLGQYDLPVEKHSLRDGVRKKANHYLTGRGGGRDIDLRKFASEGMRLYGRLKDITRGALSFQDDLAKNLDGADAVYNGICGLIDKHIADNNITAPEGQHYRPIWTPTNVPTSLDVSKAGITSVVWGTGFASDWSWIDLPIFNGNNYPSHTRGVTAMDGVFVLGLPWLHTWGSGRFVGVGNDAENLMTHIKCSLSAGLERSPLLRAVV